MLSQKKVTNKKITHPIWLMIVLLVAMLIPLNGYTADINAELVKAVLKGDTASSRSGKESQGHGGTANRQRCRRKRQGRG